MSYTGCAPLRLARDSRTVLNLMAALWPRHGIWAPMKRMLLATVALGWQYALAQTFNFTPLPFSVGGRDAVGGTPLNNAGQVVGFGAGGAGTVDGFLYGHGMTTNLGRALIPIAINDAGQITGTSESSTSPIAFLYTNGKLAPVGTLGSYSEPHNDIPINYSFAHGINARGQVIGRSSSGQGELPFLFDNAIAALHLGPSANAHGINDAGSVTGEFFAVPGVFHAFLYRNGAMTDLGTLGGPQSFGSALNAAHQVTGTSETANGGPRDAFLYSEGAMKDLGSIYGNGSAGYAINRTGQVVGLSRGSAGAAAQTTATLWSGVKTIDLNATLAVPLPNHASLIEAIGINDRGWIVANAREGSKIIAYLLTPVSPLMLSCPAAAGEKGVPYESMLSAVGGVPPYTFSDMSHVPGLKLNAGTGVLAGTPSEAGEFRASARVVDSNAAAQGTATTPCTLTIEPPAHQLKIFPPSYSFGNAARFRLLHNTFTIMNTGSRTVLIGRPAVRLDEGTHKTDFTATSLCRSALAPGKSCRIDVVVFTRDVGPLSATLSIPSNTAGSPQTIALDVNVISK